MHARRTSLLPAVGLLLSATALAPASVAAEPAIQAWTSSPTVSSARLVAATPVADPATRTLAVSTTQTYQTWQGQGAALTDSSLSLLKKSPSSAGLLFDAARTDGARLNLLRLPLSATDFSTTTWAYGWDDGTGTLTAPKPAADAASYVAGTVVPMRSDLRVVAAPWTAPAAMKDSGSLKGGALLDGSVAAYGRMLTAQASYLTQRGVPLAALSLGNEPYHSTTGYPTMLISDAQQAALANQVAGGLAARGVGLLAIDHNWEHRAHADAVEAAAPGAFVGTAFHCYGGDVSQMAGVAAPPMMTECTGTTDGFAGTFRWDALNLVVGAVKAGSTGLLMWNLALDQRNGPHTGGCSDCRGVVEVNSRTGAVTTNPEFYTLAHLARAAVPGSVVLGTGTTAGIPFVGFRNPDGRIGVMGYNDSGADQVVAVAVDGATASQRFRVPAGNLFTLRG